MANPYRNIEADLYPSALDFEWRAKLGSGASAAAWSLVLRGFAEVLQRFETSFDSPSFVLWIDGAASVFALRAVLLLWLPQDARSVSSCSWLRRFLAFVAVLDLAALPFALIEFDPTLTTLAFGAHFVATTVLTFALLVAFVRAVPWSYPIMTTVSPLIGLGVGYVAGEKLDPVFERWVLGSLSVALVGSGFAFAWLAARRRLSSVVHWRDPVFPARREAWLLVFGGGDALVLAARGRTHAFDNPVDAAHWLESHSFRADH